MFSYLLSIEVFNRQILLASFEKIFFCDRQLMESDIQSIIVKVGTASSHTQAALIAVAKPGYCD